MRKFSLALTCLLLAGCSAQQLEDRFNDGSAPPGSPPGYYTMREARYSEQQNDIDRAQFHYCNAAELGNLEARVPCVKYSLLIAGTSNVYQVCRGAPYDDASKEICKNIGPNGQQKSSQLAAQLYQQRIEAERQQQEQKQRAQTVRKNIKAKKYDLKEEDF
ncbi:MAG: hypothetical protein LUC43_05955 [Burkholderiales bacterium]|nr:hypothetical protein [Burkholderiales bacterium]